MPTSQTSEAIPAFQGLNEPALSIAYYLFTRRKTGYTQSLLPSLVQFIYTS